MLNYRKNLLLFTALLLFFVACADREQLGMAPVAAASAEAADNNNDVLSIECSVSLLSLARGLGAGYHSYTNITAVGAGAALASVADGSSDIAIFGGSLAGVPQHEGVNVMIIGAEVIHLITGMENDRVDISLDEIYALFICDNIFDDWDDWYDWDDEEWEDEFIDFAQPEEYIALTRSGVDSRVLFEELFHLRDNVGGVLQSLIPAYTNEFNDDEAVINFVRNNAETVGVVMVSDNPAGVRSLSIEGVAPGTAGYIGQREVILAYKSSNARAVSFVAYLQSGALDSVFSGSNVMRIP